MNLAKSTFDYLENHPSVKDCLKKGLINYSSLARAIASELKEDKESSFDAILIACRRFADKYKSSQSSETRIMALLKKGRFEIHSKVSAIILSQGAGLDAVLKASGKVMDSADNFHLIQGTKTITVVVDDAFASGIADSLKHFVVKYRKGLVQMTHKTSEDVESTPGFLNHLTSIFSDNGVNIYEAMSSWTDTIFLIDENDAAKVFSLLGFK